jgi:hypothetical protein
MVGTNRSNHWKMMKNRNFNRWNFFISAVAACCLSQGLTTAMAAAPVAEKPNIIFILEDPTELNNVAEDHPALVELLSAKLLQWHHELPRAPISEKAGSNMYPWPGAK